MATLPNAKPRSRPDRYETLFPSATSDNPPPPPLPPRTHHLKHRPLERTKAIEHYSSSPPKVSRRTKPAYPSDVPAVPPKPKKFLHPEDAFHFEIVDMDEQGEMRLPGVGATPPVCADPLAAAAPARQPDSITNNHSSQNCDIRVSGPTTARLSVVPKYSEVAVAGADSSGDPLFKSDRSSQESLMHCFLTVPDATHTSSTSSVSPNSGNSVSTPTSDSGIAFSEIGCRDCSSSSTESSEFESVARKPDDDCDESVVVVVGAVRGHKLLSRQSSQPSDSGAQLMRGPTTAAAAAAALTVNTALTSCANKTATIGHSASSRLQCPPTPTHHARRMKANSDGEHGTSSRCQNEVSVQSPLRRTYAADTARVPTDSSNSDSDTPSQSLRRRTVRLPSISENTRIQRVEVLPDGDRLPPGECSHERVVHFAAPSHSQSSFSASCRATGNHSTFRILRTRLAC